MTKGSSGWTDLTWQMDFAPGPDSAALKTFISDANRTLTGWQTICRPCSERRQR